MLFPMDEMVILNEVKDLISITNAPSQTPADEVVIIDDDTNDTSKYTATAEVTVYPEASDDLSAFIYDVRINLEGKVGIDFYFYNKPEGYDNTNLYAVFDGPSADENANVNGNAPMGLMLFFGSETEKQYAKQ